MARRVLHRYHRHCHHQNHTGFNTVIGVDFYDLNQCISHFVIAVTALTKVRLSGKFGL